MLALGALLCLPATGHAQTAEALYRQTAAQFHRLRAETPAPAHKWREVAGAFRRLHDDFPRHQRAPDALFSAALAVREAFLAGGSRADLTQAADLFGQFAGDHAGHRLADDALMHLAALQAEHQRAPQQARRTYRRVLRVYPKGDQAAAAGERLAALPAGPAPAAAPERARGGLLGTTAAMGLPIFHAATPDQPDPAAAAAGATPAPDGTATLKRVQFWSALDFTRVILTTDALVDYRPHRLAPYDGKPERLYVDLPGVVPDASLGGEQAVGDRVLQRIRVSRHAARTTRVVLDLTGLERYQIRTFGLPTEKKLVVDLYPVAAAPPPPPRAPAEGSARISLRNALGLKVKTVVIDSGHGGHDPGAVAFGLREKDVALSIARMLREVFAERRPDIRVRMTRDSDVFIPLEQRPVLAKNMDADLFISIHLNAHEREHVHGVESYFLNLTTDAYALRIAARENASTARQLSDLNGILADLLRDSNILESSRLAHDLQASLVASLGGGRQVRDLGVKQAPFMVLVGAEMPSVLVEAGFITNRRENRRLREPAYQRRIAEGIYDGLQKYIQAHKLAGGDASAPPGALSRS